jgi:hypothetical protein
MQAKYTNFTTDDRDYPDVKGTILKSAFPKPQSTIASESVAKARKAKEDKVMDSEFTMRRFKNIPAKVTQYF